jgi:hypothetical protein
MPRGIPKTKPKSTTRAKTTGSKSRTMPASAKPATKRKTPTTRRK